jgi:hypothetical protein
MNYSPFDDPILRNWFEQCPCTWDMEYVEDWDRLAFSFALLAIMLRIFFNLFANYSLSEAYCFYPSKFIT